MEGSPDLGSWNDAEPPTGTALAARMRVPEGFLTEVVVGEDAPDPVAAVVGAVGAVGAEVPELPTGVRD